MAYSFTPIFFPFFFLNFTCAVGLVERLFTNHLPPQVHISYPPMKTFLPAELDLEPIRGRSVDFSSALGKARFVHAAKTAFFSLSDFTTPSV